MEKRNLDLSEFVVADKDLPTATNNEVTVKIPADVPFDIMVKTGKVHDLKPASEAQMLGMKAIIVEILELKNNADDVEEFMENIEFKEFNRLFKFIFEYVNAASDDENQVKKKNS